MGIVLITVSGIAWRLTATDAPSCRAMLGLGGGCGGNGANGDDDHNGRFLARPSNGNNGFGGTPFASNARAQHPYAGK